MVFQGDCTNLYSSELCIRVPVGPKPYLTLHIFLFFLTSRHLLKSILGSSRRGSVVNESD